eukprot:750748-Hanusia_phi.AAC.1
MGTVWEVRKPWDLVPFLIAVRRSGMARRWLAAGEFVSCFKQEVRRSLVRRNLTASQVVKLCKLRHPNVVRELIRQSEGREAKQEYDTVSEFFGSFQQESSWSVVTELLDWDLRSPVCSRP